MSKTSENVGGPAPRKRIPISILRELFSYNPETGEIRRILPSKKSKVGDLVGGIAPNGYWRIKLGRVHLYSHRVAWAMMTGEWPEWQIDHKDGVRRNNRWSNLRAATSSHNNQNQRLLGRNTSGHKGVYWHKAKQHWVARIGHNGKRYSLGCYSTVEDAAAAYEEAAIRFHGEFARLR